MSGSAQQLRQHIAGQQRHRHQQADSLACDPRHRRAGGAALGKRVGKGGKQDKRDDGGDILNNEETHGNAAVQRIDFTLV